MARFITSILFICSLGLTLKSLAYQGFPVKTQTDSLIEVAKDLSPEKKIEALSTIIDTAANLTPKTKANAYLDIGIAYSRLNRFRSSINNYDKASAICLTNNLLAQYSRALNLKGVSLNHMHQYGKAIETFQKALTIREELGEKLLVASTLNNLAICYRASSQLDAAIAHYQRSNKLYKEVGDLKGQSYVLNNLGLVHLAKDNYDEAISFLNQSLSLKQQLGDTLNLATTYTSLGNVYKKVNRFDLALNHHTTAANYYLEANDNNGLSDSDNNIAEVYLSKGKLDEAFEFIKKAQSLINFEETSSVALNNIRLLSDYYLAVGELKKSRELLSQFIDKYTQVQNDMVNSQIAELSIMFENDRFEQERGLLEINLDIEKLKVQKAKITQYAITLVAALLLILLIASLLFILRYKRKRAELEKVNTELNHINSHLETIVETRTQDLLETLKKAQQSDKQKSAFLANMSHEIRTPLNGILGFSKLLTDDSLSKSERNQFVGLINRRGRNLLHIVNDIINISLIDAGQVEPQKISFNLNQIMYDLQAMFTSADYDKRKASVNLKMSLALSDSRSVIISDPNRIEQIITNLVDNAFKFTNIGEVEYGYSVLPSNTIRFFVRDTGSGIPDEKKNMVFKRFNRTDEELAQGYSATGLGLPICKGLVDLLNGKIWFETRLNVGTTFYFTIPFLPGQTESKSYISRSAVQNILFKGKVILVVEDDLISYQFIEALLKPTEAKLLHAKNGEDAIEIASIRTDIDLVIMDMRLPFIDGYEATTRIKTFNPELTVIAQTANAMSYDKDKCLSVGCDDYLSKPIDPDDLLRTIAFYINKTSKTRKV